MCLRDFSPNSLGDDTWSILTNPLFFILKCNIIYHFAVLDRYII